MAGPRDASRGPQTGGVRNAVYNPGVHIDHFDDILGFNQVPSATSIARAERTVAGFKAKPPAGISSKIQPGSTAAGDLWFMDFETIGASRNAPVVTGAMMSRDEIIKLAGGEVSASNIKKTMEEAARLKDQAFIVDVGTGMGVAKPLGPSTVGEWDILAEQVKRARTFEGKRPMADILAEQAALPIKQEAAKANRHTAEVLIERMRLAKSPSEMLNHLKGTLGPTGKPETVANFFTRQLERISQHGGGTLIVHNLPFESGLLSTRFANQGMSHATGGPLMKDVGKYLYRGSITGQGGMLDRRLFQTAAEISNASAMLRARQALKGADIGAAGERLFHAINQHMNVDAAHGLVKIVDSMDIFRSVSAMAESKGFLTQIGVTHGLGIQDFLDAYKPGLKELHLAGADDVATMKLVEHQMEAGKLLAKGDRQSRQALEAKFGEFFRRLNITRMDSAKAEERLIDRMTTQISDTLAGRPVRLMEGDIIHGSFVPRPSVYEAASMGYDNTTQQMVATSQRVYRPKYKSMNRSIEDLLEHNWATMGEYHRKNISRERFDEITSVLRPLLQDTDKGLSATETAFRQQVNELGRQTRAFGLAGDKAEHIVAAELTEKISQAFRRQRMSPVVPKMKTMKSFGRTAMPAVAGLAIGLGATYLWEGEPERESERILDINQGGTGRPVGSVLVGMGLAAGGIALGAGAFRKTALRGPAFIGAAIAGGYAVASGLHDLMNRQESVDMGGSLGSGLTAMGFGTAAAVGRGGLQAPPVILDGMKKYASKMTTNSWMSRVGRVIERHKVAGAGLAAMTVALAASYMWDGEPTMAYPDGMNEGGVNEVNRKTLTDFGSAYAGAQGGSRIGRLIFRKGMHETISAGSREWNNVMSVAGQSRLMKVINKVVSPTDTGAVMNLPRAGLPSPNLPSSVKTPRFADIFQGTKNNGPSGLFFASQKEARRAPVQVYEGMKIPMSPLKEMTGPIRAVSRDVQRSLPKSLDRGMIRTSGPSPITRPDRLRRSRTFTPRNVPVTGGRPANKGYLLS